MDDDLFQAEDEPGLLQRTTNHSGPNKSALCFACHQPFTRRGNQGACAHCLGRFASLPDDAFEEEAIIEPTGIRARRYGHFEILTYLDGSPVELGHGSMGTAYRARDTVLNRDVALKVIAGSVAEHPAVRARFLREARAAAQFQHPNVAAVSHYGEQEGECFYAMELVAGETLAERVRRDGPLPVAQALQITVEVTQALAAAEARGIVHRDLKPGNIMLELAGHDANGRPIPRVKIIDFGLAKATTAVEDSGPEDTRGGFVGTPAFASPEQFAGGEGGRIDTRSDIYSLGVTLWYLLCGKLPYLGRTLTEIHEQQTRERLPWEQLKIARVPKAVTSLLRSMLSVAPASRPQSARELLAALEQCRRALPSSADVRRRRRRWLLAASLVLASLIGAGLYRATRSPPPPPDRSIAVLPSENRSVNPADVFFTTGVREQISADLARIGQLKVVASESTNGYPVDKPRDFASIGHALKMRYLLDGSLQRQEDRFEVRVRLIDVDDPSHPWTARYVRSLPEIFALQGEITRAVADRLQASLTPGERAAVNRPTTTNLAAYQLYLQATSPFMAHSDPELRAAARRNIALLEQAIAIDPNFVLAYCEAAHLHDQIVLYCASMTAEELAEDHRSQAEVCLTRAQQIQPDAGEVYYALAFHFFQVIRDNEQAAREIALARRALPHNAEVVALSGRLAVRQSRWEEAFRSLEQAAELDPRDPGKIELLMYLYHAFRRYPEWERGARQYTQLAAASSGKEYFPYGDALIRLERTADLEPLRRVFTPPSPYAGNVSVALALYFYAGDADALAGFLSGSQQSEYVRLGYVFPREWYEAMVALLRNDRDAMRISLAVARPKLEQAVRDQPKEGIQLALLAKADALLGNTQEAVREARRACELTSFQNNPLAAPIVRCDLAVVYAWTNQPDLAFAELDQLLGMPFEGAFVIDQPTYGDFRLNPLWRPLRADPRFEAILHRLAPGKAP